MKTVSLGMRADPWYGTIFLFLEQIALSWRHISALIHARVVGSHVNGIKWWELWDSLADISQRWQGIRQRRGTRVLLCSFILSFNGKGVFFSVENFFNFALWMNKIRSLASCGYWLLCLFYREKFCKKTVYSGIGLICEFAKQCLIIAKTCF